MSRCQRVEGGGGGEGEMKVEGRIRFWLSITKGKKEEEKAAVWPDLVQLSPYFFCAVGLTILQKICHFYFDMVENVFLLPWRGHIYSVNHAIIVNNSEGILKNVY